jgi:ADP-ribosylglycohydrolase
MSEPEEHTPGDGQSGTRTAGADNGSFARGCAAFYGLAVGDALGMPTQLMSRDEVRQRYGRVTTFLAAAPDHPLAPGLAAGTVTDDTEQAVLLGRHLVAHNGHVDPRALAAEFVAWEHDVRSRGSLDLLGPSTRAAVAAILAGTPVDESGRHGMTNGAAMRATPIGIMMPSHDLDALVERVVEASSVTHNTGVAIAGAAAVSAAVSAAIDGADLESVVETAVQAAELGAARGHWVAGADVGRRIQWAVSIADPADPAASETELYRSIGTSLATQESVPAAFGLLATYPGDPWAVCCSAASLGGDADTVAAMAGAVAGALTGPSGIPGWARETVNRVNRFDPSGLVADLLALR